MRTRRHLLLAAAAFAALTPIAAAPALAQRLEPNQFSREYQGRRDAEPRVLTAREVINRVQRDRGGEPIGRVEYDANRRVYIMIWRTPDGRSGRIVVDAVSGRVVG